VRSGATARAEALGNLGNPTPDGSKDRRLTVRPGPDRHPHS
jgi:hypothetical protein